MRFKPSLRRTKNVEMKDLVELSFNANNEDNDSLDELDDDDDDNTIKKVSRRLTKYNILKVSELKKECKKRTRRYSNLKNMN